MLLAVHAVAASSTFSLCQTGLGLWKLCWPCLETAPNSHFPMAWRGGGRGRGVEGAEGGWGDRSNGGNKKSKSLGAHTMTGSCQENK